MSNYLELPFEIQVSLAAGFLGYCVAYSGKRNHHKAYESAMIILIFGTPSIAAIKASKSIFSPEIQIIYAAACSLAMAIIWRRFLSKKVFKFLRNQKISQEDENLGPWQNISQDTDTKISQLNVRLKNGRVLFCTNLSDYNGAPHGPALFGSDGSIAMYATKITTSNGTIHEVSPKDLGGFQITYIPKEEISEVDLRIVAEKL
jgi:hypothetical protein